MNSYPHEIDFSNQFYADSVDLDMFDFPKLRVVTWSNLFGEGGSYSIEPVQSSTSYWLRIMSVSVKHTDRALYAHLQDLVDDWNEDPRENWLRILRRALQQNAEYQQKKVDTFDEVAAKSRQANERLAQIEALVKDRQDA